MQRIRLQDTDLPSSAHPLSPAFCIPYSRRIDSEPFVNVCARDLLSQFRTVPVAWCCTISRTANLLTADRLEASCEGLLPEWGRPP
jgi:hypothetical protein